MKREALQALMAAIIDSGCSETVSLTTVQCVNRAELILNEVEAQYFRSTKRDLQWGKE